MCQVGAAEVRVVPIRLVPDLLECFQSEATKCLCVRNMMYVYPRKLAERQTLLHRCQVSELESSLCRHTDKVRGSVREYYEQHNAKQ